MAFILAPRLASAYQAPQCSPFAICAPVSRPTHTYRIAQPRPQRLQYSLFNHFFGQVDDLLSEIDLETQHQARQEIQREAHRQRQQRKRDLRAKFTARETEQGWQIDGDINGFDQDSISIQVTDEHTLKVAGNTEWHVEKNSEPAKHRPEVEPASTTQPDAATDGVTINEPEFETLDEADTATISAATPDSDTESRKSHQPTVEDDFEDLGAETSSLISSKSRASSPAEVHETKGKEKAAEASNSTDATSVVPPQSEARVQQEEPESTKNKRIHGSFERTFQFPGRIDGANVTASFKHGALKVTVPRAQVQEVRRIAIV